jgi:hypothetical protein
LYATLHGISTACFTKPDSSDILVYLHFTIFFVLHRWQGATVKV